MALGSHLSNEDLAFRIRRLNHSDEPVAAAASGIGGFGVASIFGIRLIIFVFGDF